MSQPTTVYGCSDLNNTATDATANVMQQFNNLFNANSTELLQCFGENSVLDWFGRTIKGARNIRDYVRNSICEEYMHVNFKNAKPCTSIEYRPSHFKTKSQPIIGNSVSRLNKVPIMPHLKLRADSDVEEDDAPRSTAAATGNAATATIAKNSHEENSMSLSPVPTRSSAINELGLKSHVLETTDSDSDDAAKETTDMQHRHKRLKRTHSPQYTHTLSHAALKRTYITPKEASDLGLRSIFINDSDVDDDGDDDNSNEVEATESTFNTTVAADSDINIFSPLHYIETKVTLRSRSNKTTTPTAWDKKVRVRISYRQHLTDGHIYFALIIYDDYNRKNTHRESRRCLMSEFAQVDDILNAAEGTTQTIIVEEAGAQLLNESAFSINDDLTAAGDNTIIAGNETTPTTEDIAAALESVTFTIGPPRTPTKTPHTPPPTPKRRRRFISNTLPGIRRPQQATQNMASTLFAAAATPKRKAVRSLRL